MTVSAYRLSAGDFETKPGPEDYFAKLRLYLCDAIKQVLYFTKSPVITAFKVTGDTLSIARARHKTAWLAVDWVNWSAHGKSKWAGLTNIG